MIAQAGAAAGKIRVLSLDGGGSRASILARALAEFYPGMSGRQILRQFSYVAGNSGGSLVIAALCCDYTPRQIAGFYEDPRTLRRMFSPRRTSRFPVLRDVLPRYSTAGKLLGLTEILDAQRKQGEPLPSTVKLSGWPQLLGADLDILIPAFDVDRQRTTFFRSSPASRAKSSEPRLDVTLLQATHASTTPPIFYFDEPAAFAGRRFWDGALGGYNNPVLAAVIEVLANRPDAAQQVRVLSIGTGSQSRPPQGALAPPPLGQAPVASWLDEVKVATSVIFDDPPDAATFHAHVALGQPLPARGESTTAGNVVRVCPFVHPAWSGTEWQLPAGLAKAEFQRLYDMRLDAHDAEAIGLVRKLTDLWIQGRVPNQPVRAGQNYACDVGDPTFAQALQRWRAIS